MYRLRMQSKHEMMRASSPRRDIPVEMAPVMGYPMLEKKRGDQPPCLPSDSFAPVSTI